MVVADPPRVRMGRPSAGERATLVEYAEEAYAEVAARRSEEQEQARAIRPLLDRLYLYAIDAGPAAFQTVAAVERWHKRHSARWADAS